MINIFGALIKIYLKTKKETLKNESDRKIQKKKKNMSKMRKF